MEKKNISDWISRYAHFGIVSDSVQDISAWRVALSEDPFWRELRGIGDAVGPPVRHFKWGRFEFDRTHFTEVDGICKYRGKILVPETYVNSLLERIHYQDQFTSHQGHIRTMKVVAQSYYWVNWRRDVVDFVNACERCAKNKRAKLTQVPKTHLAVPERKFGTISIDIWGFGALDECKGYKGIVTVVDRLTNYIQLLPIKTKEMSEIMQVLSRGWISKFGFPDNIHADNEFNNAWLDAYCDYFKVSRSFTGFYAPFQNGQVERIHRFIGDQIRALEEEKINWVDYIDYIATKYNTGWCSAVNESPHYLVYGQDFRFTSDEDESTLRRIGQLFADVKRMQLIEENVQEYRNSKFKTFLQNLDRHHTEHEEQFLPGDVVWWLSHQTNSRIRKLEGASGPYRVMKVLADNLVELDRIDGKNHQYIRAATSQLRRCTSDDCDI